MAATKKKKKKTADLTESQKPSFSKLGSKNLSHFPPNLQARIHTFPHENLYITLCSYLKLLIAIFLKGLVFVCQ